MSTSQTRSRDTMGKVGGLAPEYLATPELLDAISPSAERGGALFGTDTRNEPASVSLLRPVPTRVVTLGGLYLARQLALRALAAGAWVIIATGRQQAWAPLLAATQTGPNERQLPVVSVRRLSPIELPDGTEENPVLVVHDGGATPVELLPPRTPWQTTMYVLPYLHPQAGSIAANADLVLMQRLQAAQAQLAARMWRLAPARVTEVTQLRDDHVLALGQDLWVSIRLVTNEGEKQILGPVRRGD
ncbi:hypothetical protein [Kutzneria buriramensis]|uniref:Uncharacterized protein n=1 Tax=Kutzneria buriramensis TaxID=1045776 RepID=A0A3E0IA28_9PSEU|nr:hypothetical protein [Kutzneria buriramensis]REH55530.1 hypothetical protein BCF44_101554 [Kutzneria buriramensis]